MDCGFYLGKTEGLFNNLCTRRGNFFLGPLILIWMVTICSWGASAGRPAGSLLRHGGGHGCHRGAHRRPRSLVSEHQTAIQNHGEVERQPASSPGRSTRDETEQRGPAAAAVCSQLGEIQNSRFTKIGHGLDNLDAKREMRGGSGAL